MKIALVNNNTSGMWLFRRELIQTLVYNGHEVFVLSPSDDFVPNMEMMGAKHIPIPLCRFPSVTKDFRLYWSLRGILKKIKPDIVHTMTIKPNTFGVYAAKHAKVPKIIGLVCGAGNAFFPPKTLTKKMLYHLVCFLYKRSISKMDRLWFLNEEDKNQFENLKLVQEQKAVLIKSEGVNLKRYAPGAVSRHSIIELKKELGIDENTVSILLVGRMLWSKGIKEFVETSKIAKTWPYKTKFILVGPEDPDAPDTVPKKYLQDSENFLYLGMRSDVPELLQLSDIVVLPSFYREGVPRVLLEAMAMHKPIVTTDNVGCRDTVDHKKTGFVVPIQNTHAFANAVQSLVVDQSLRIQFGEQAFEKVKNEFSVELVINRVLHELYQLRNFSIPDFAE